MGLIHLIGKVQAQEHVATTSQPGSGDVSGATTKEAPKMQKHVGFLKSSEGQGRKPEN